METLELIPGMETFVVYPGKAASPTSATTSNSRWNGCIFYPFAKSSSFFELKIERNSQMMLICDKLPPVLNPAVFPEKAHFPTLYFGKKYMIYTIVRGGGPSFSGYF